MAAASIDLVSALLERGDNIRLYSVLVDVSILQGEC